MPLQRVSACLAGFLIAVPSLHAQVESEIRIRVEAAPGQPVAGALVGLMDQSGRLVTEGISSTTGVRVLRAPQGDYRVRVRRIGFTPYVSASARIPRAGDLVLRIESQPVALKSVVVVAGTPCQRIDRDLETVAVVWEEIAKALSTSRLTNADLAGVAQTRKYRRLVTEGGTVISADTTFGEISNKIPFGAIDPVILASKGYVQGDINTGWDYFGPDETVLLSSEFASTHCFRLLREKERTGRIGLAFKPVPGRKIADIAGVLWVDEATSELREMIFEFVNAGVIDQFEAGGFTRFRRMPSGAWLVDEWQLRMPRLEIRRDQQSQLVAVAYMENGGGIVTAADRTPMRLKADSIPASR